MKFDGLKIVITCINPPIPDRKHDWCAYLDDDPEDTWHYGYGKNPEEALIALADALGSTWADQQAEKNEPAETPYQESRAYLVEESRRYE